MANKNHVHCCLKGNTYFNYDWLPITEKPMQTILIAYENQPGLRCNIEFGFRAHFIPPHLGPELLMRF